MLLFVLFEGDIMARSPNEFLAGEMFMRVGHEPV